MDSDPGDSDDQLCSVLDCRAFLWAVAGIQGEKED